MAARSKSTPGLPQRNTHSEGMPARARRKSDRYLVWQPEIDALRESLGQAFSYENVEKASTVAQGIRRTFGVVARVTDLVEGDKTRTGTIWLQYPYVDNGDGTISPDDAEVAEIKAKYASSGNGNVSEDSE